MPDLFIELFSEEIPARMQKGAAENLRKLMTDGMVEAGLAYAAAAAYATPRRLTLTVEGLAANSPTTTEERRGPRIDAPEKAIEGFLRSTGLTRDQLSEVEEKKGTFLVAKVTHEGRPAADIVAEVLENTIRKFPWPKSMRWGSGPLRWVRPLHSIVAILSDEAGATVVPLTIDGTVAGDTTSGHRFHAPEPFAVTSFEDYEQKLGRAHVVLRPETRADSILADARNLAFAQGLELVEDAGLLAEVAGLVEWPVTLMGKIGSDFLDLPPEVLQLSMKEHQKFFSVRNPATGRIEGYVTVANRETADNGATILAGNDKVLAARLSDAKFFWENDLRVAKSSMDGWLASLANVTFHRKLGSQADRIDRIATFARDLAPKTGADADLCEQAARTCKADLASEMVYEFPDLQGTMGRYYAENAGLPSEVAAAAEGHYAPLGPSDDTPKAPVTRTVALADKLDTLAGFWAIDEKPTGSKDPYALRRAALGVIRIILDNDLRIRLTNRIETQLLRNEIAASAETPDQSNIEFVSEILKEIRDEGLFGAAWGAVTEMFEHRTEDPRFAPSDWLLSLRENVPEATADLLSFLHDRLKVHLKGEGIRHDVIDASLAMDGADDLVLLVSRARALNAFLATDDGENLLQGYRRANNILTAEEEKDGIEYSLDPDAKFSENAEEKALFAALDTAAPAIRAAIGAEDFGAAMSALAGLRKPIDAFFEATLINTDNAIVRRNRLCLLNRIRVVTGGIADFSRVEGG